MSHDSRFLRTKEITINNQNGPGAWYCARYAILEPNNYPGDNKEYQRKIVIWLRDNNDANVFVNKNANLSDLTFKTGAAVTIPRDECAVACITDNCVTISRSEFHGGTVLVSLPKNGLSNPQWDTQDENGNIDSNTINNCIMYGPPGHTAILSVECDDAIINPGDIVTFRIYKKDTVPNGTNCVAQKDIPKGSDNTLKFEWEYQYTDDEYPADINPAVSPRPEYFFEVFTECANVIQSDTFVTNWIRLDNNMISILETQQSAMPPVYPFQQSFNGLQQLPGVDHEPLSYFINTHVLAEIIKQNSHAFDADTKAYNAETKKFIDNNTPNSIEKPLNSITVYFDINKSGVNTLFGLINAAGSFKDALTLGKNIYYKRGNITRADSKGSASMTKEKASLLAHEAIYAIQAAAWEAKRPGEGTARFITFCANNAYTEDANPYELDAYKFGGKFPTFRNVNSTPIVDSYIPLSPGGQVVSNYQWWR